MPGARACARASHLGRYTSFTTGRVVWHALDDIFMRIFMRRFMRLPHTLLERAYGSV